MWFTRSGWNVSQKCKVVWKPRLEVPGRGSISKIPVCRRHQRLPSGASAPSSARPYFDISLPGIFDDIIFYCWQFDFSIFRYYFANEIEHEQQMSLTACRMYFSGGKRLAFQDPIRMTYVNVPADNHTRHRYYLCIR
jgi:hypothetical protein